MLQVETMRRLERSLSCPVRLTEVGDKLQIESGGLVLLFGVPQGGVPTLWFGVFPVWEADRCYETSEVSPLPLIGARINLGLKFLSYEFGQELMRLNFGRSIWDDPVTIDLVAVQTADARRKAAAVRFCGANIWRH